MFGASYGKKRVELSEIDKAVEKCVDQSHLFVSSMTRYDPHPSMVKAHLAGVEDMVEEIKRRHAEMTTTAATRSQRTGPGKPAPAAGHWTGPDAAEPGRHLVAQYERFLKREPAGNTMDKRILAETASIRDIVGGGPERFCIASNDMGIFAPLLLRGGRTSSPIVDMIRDRFAITCGFPRDIREMCAGP